MLLPGRHLAVCFPVLWKTCGKLFKFNEKTGLEKSLYGCGLVRGDLLRFSVIFKLFHVLLKRCLDSV
ncbi:MAG: hypothetical protein CSA81_10775 [Acidobacteria bacterium]|nr:MAG: hypothetical protein CSA81_10775 [Acidobacteriota bacterium]